MSSFTTHAAQGDVYFRKVDSMPTGVSEVLPEQSKIIVTHSETGHHHIFDVDVIDKNPNVRLYSGDNPLVSWLEINRPSTLKHMRSFDTHDPIIFQPGIYEVRRQREYTPQGLRPVQD